MSTTRTSMIALGVFVLFMFPLFVLAQGAGASSGTVNTGFLVYYSNVIIWVVNSILVPVLMAIAFIVFLWGVFKYFILGAADETKRAEGRQFVLWGIIGFVIISSLWGLVNIVKASLLPSGASNNTPPAPTITFPKP